MSQTINILAGEKNGVPYHEAVPVQKFGISLYRVVERAGNICVQIFFTGDKIAAAREFGRRFKNLNGRLDGGFEGDSSFLLIHTIPYSGDFKAIEAVFNELPREIVLDIWMYGNVYEDDGSLLNWWE
jgi:hypothetical protein